MLGLPMLVLTSIALACLLAGPAEPAEPSYADAVAEVERLNLAVNRDPETNHPALAAAIERLTEFADELAGDERARKLRTLAQLNVARALLRAGDEDGAGLVVDEAIRAAGDAEVPASSFGPKLADFHAKRRDALEEWGTGALVVECTVACRVLIDEREVEGGATGLVFGTYRVWIAAEDPTLVEDPAGVRHELVIDIDGELETLRYEPAPRVVVESEPIPEPIPKPVAKPAKRLLPRWVEIVGLVAGAGLIATGAALTSTDGNCIAGGLDPMSDAQQCPQLWESTASGAAMLGLGAALAVTGGVMLAVDEVRVNGQAGTRAVLTWTLQF